MLCVTGVLTQLLRCVSRPDQAVFNAEEEEDEEQLNSRDLADEPWRRQVIANLAKHVLFSKTHTQACPRWQRVCEHTPCSQRIRSVPANMLLCLSRYHRQWATPLDSPTSSCSCICSRLKAFAWHLPHLTKNVLPPQTAVLICKHNQHH